MTRSHFVLEAIRLRPAPVEDTGSGVEWRGLGCEVCSVWVAWRLTAERVLANMGEGREVVDVRKPPG